MQASNQLYFCFLRFQPFFQCRSEVVEQLEERIIVPDDTKILLKRVGTLSAPTASGKKSKLKRVRFSLPRAAFESTSDSSDSDDDDEDAGSGAGKAKKRGKRAKKKGSDDEDEFTLEEAEAELDGDDEEEENEGAGTGNGCSQCGTISAKQLHEDEHTGDLLCNTCLAARGGGASGSGAAAGNGGKACYHCRNDEESKLQKHAESGGWECLTCKRYRVSHNGELRPAKLFNRKPRASTAAAAGGGGGAGGGSAGAFGSTPVTVPTPRNQQGTSRSSSALRAPADQQTRQANAQNRVFRLQENFGVHSARLMKHFTTTKTSDTIMDTMRNSYNLKALGNGANQVAIEILSAKGAGEGNTAWGDLRRQLIE